MVVAEVMGVVVEEGALAVGALAMAGLEEAAFLMASQVGVMASAVVLVAALPLLELSVRPTPLLGAVLLAVALGAAFMVTVTASPASVYPG